MLAVPLLASVSLGASPLQLGIIVVAELLPQPFFGLIAGAFADRLNKVFLVAMADLARAAIQLSITCLWSADALNFPTLIGLVFLGGIFDTLAGAAYYAAVAELVPKNELVQANSKISTAVTVAMLVGPPLAGVSLSYFTAPMILLANSACFAISAALLWRCSCTIQRSSIPESTRLSLLGDIREGVNYINRHGMLKRLLVVSLAFGFLLQSHIALFTVYAVRTLSVTPPALGSIIAVGAGFGMVSSVIFARSAVDLKVVTILLLGLVSVASGWGLLAASYQFTHLRSPFFILGFILFSIGTVLYDIGAVSMRQIMTIGPMHGRVTATMRLVAAVPAPLGALLGGFLSSCFDTSVTFFLMSVLCGCIALFILLSIRSWSNVSTSSRTEAQNDNHQPA